MWRNTGMTSKGKLTAAAAKIFQKDRGEIKNLYNGKRNCTTKWSHYKQAENKYDRRSTKGTPEICP